MKPQFNAEDVINLLEDAIKAIKNADTKTAEEKTTVALHDIVEFNRPYLAR